MAMAAAARVVNHMKATSGGQEHEEEGTSQAISSLRVALAGMVASAVLSLWFADRWPWLTAVPCVLINCCFLQVSPVHGLLFSAFEIAYLMALIWPLKAALGVPLKYAFFWLYSPIFVIFGRKQKDRHNLLGELFIRCVWDPPLLATIWLVGLTRLGGDRFLFPFCTVLDDQIAMGSLPLPWDVKTLVEEHNIGAVVNMTAEYAGPVDHYERHGVRQLHLPTVDTAAPTLEQVQRGVAFIEEFLEANPGQRVFIHCKGGRGRAAVMTAAYYIKQRRGEMPPHEVVRELKAKRFVVSTAVAKYEVVQDFHAHVVSTHSTHGGKAGPPSKSTGATPKGKANSKAKAKAT